MLRRIISVGAETIEKPPQSSRVSKPLEFSTVPGVYSEAERLFAAENPVSRAKTGEGARRGACIPVRRLVKTFSDKLPTRFFEAFCAVRN